MIKMKIYLKIIYILWQTMMTAFQFIQKIKNVYLIKGKPFKFYGDNVVHGILDLNKVKVESKKYNVTIT